MLIILAATALAAAITIPALAQDGSGGAQDPALARFTACLTAHGVTPPAGLGGRELKQWLAAHQDEATVSAAMQACAGPDRTDDKLVELRACLRNHGVDVGDAPDQLKGKMLELSRTDAGRAILNACNSEPAKPPAGAADKPAPGDCGDAQLAPAPAETPKQGT